MKRVLVAIVLVALMASPVLAQTDVRCVGLEEADCTTLVTALENTTSSGAFNNKAFTLTVGGGGGTSTGNEFTVAGSGPMLLNEEGSIHAFDLTVTGDINEENSQGEIIWLEDMLYIGRADETGDLAWTGSPSDTEQGEFLLSLLSGNLLLTALNAPGVVVTQRGEDVEHEGQAMQVFNSDADLVTLLLTPQVLEVLQTLLENLPEDFASGMGGGAEQMGGADLAGAIPLLALLFTQDTVERVIWVGAEDGLVHHVEFLIDWVIDPSIIDPSQSPIAFKFALSTDLDQHGATFELAAPADFELTEGINLDLGGLSLESIMGGGAAPEAVEIPLDVENTLAYGETVTGTLTDDNAQDVWGFTAAAGDIVTITLKTANPESVLDTVLSLYDDAGNELTSNDDHGTENETLLFSDAVILNFELPATGDYRILATWLAPVTDGAYELTLEKVN